MGFVITLIILYNIFGKSNPKVYHKVHSGLPKIIGGLIALSIFGSAIPALLGAGLGLLAFYRYRLACQDLIGK